MGDWAFVEHATKQLMRPRPGDSKGPTLWPSEASATYVDEDGTEVTVGKCRRAMFFRYLIDSYKFYEKYKLWRPLVERLQREAKPVDRYMLWIWAAGEQAEEFLIDQAKKSGVYESEQVPVYIKSHRVSGKKDIEVYNPESGKLSIVEAKSVYGFGANMVLGTEAQRRRGTMGTPRDSNLMQIAIYHWWSASLDDAYEDSRLVYIARDTGRYAEYLVRTVEDEDGTIHIEYRPWHPYKGAWKRVKFTINQILDSYEATQLAVDSGRIPPRDFDLSWSPERLDRAFKAGELGKTDAQKYEKAKARSDYNSWVLHVQTVLATPDLDIAGFAHEQRPQAQAHRDEIPVAVERALTAYEQDDDAAGDFVKSLSKLKTKKELKQLEKGDWQCRFCKFSPICYSNGEPKEV